MTLRELTDLAFKYRHVKTGEIIYALPVISHISTHIRTKGNHGRIFLLDMTYFKNRIEEYENGAYVYVKEKEITNVMMFNTKCSHIYQTTREVLITEYDELDN